MSSFWNSFILNLIYPFTFCMNPSVTFIALNLKSRKYKLKWLSSGRRSYHPLFINLTLILDYIGFSSFWFINLRQNRTVGVEFVTNCTKFFMVLITIQANSTQQNYLLWTGRIYPPCIPMDQLTVPLIHSATMANYMKWKILKNICFELASP